VTLEPRAGEFRIERTETAPPVDAVVVVDVPVGVVPAGVVDAGGAVVVGVVGWPPLGVVEAGGLATGGELGVLVVPDVVPDPLVLGGAVVVEVPEPEGVVGVPEPAGVVGVPEPEGVVGVPEPAGVVEVPESAGVVEVGEPPAVAEVPEPPAFVEVPDPPAVEELPLGAVPTAPLDTVLGGVVGGGGWLPASALAALTAVASPAPSAKDEATAVARFRCSRSHAAAEAWLGAVARARKRSGVVPTVLRRRADAASGAADSAGAAREGTGSGSGACEALTSSKPTRACSTTANGSL
jgi:hypothetical protein